MVAPQAIVAWLLDENPVRDSTLDADGDGNTLIDEKILALVDDDYCTRSSTTCSATDEAALAKTRKQLRAFTDQGGGPGYVIERSNQAGNVLPQDFGAIDLHDLLDPTGRTVRIRCVALPEEAQKKAEPYWHTNGDDGDSGFRLSGDIDNLSKSRGSLGAVKAAELSITSDLIENETAYRVNAVAGYAFDAPAARTFRRPSFPFLKLNGSPAGMRRRSTRLGLVFSWPLP